MHPEQYSNASPAKAVTLQIEEFDGLSPFVARQGVQAGRRHRGPFMLRLRHCRSTFEEAQVPGVIAKLTQHDARWQTLTQCLHHMLAQYRIVADADEHQRAFDLLKVECQTRNCLVKSAHSSYPVATQQR